MNDNNQTIYNGNEKPTNTGVVPVTNLQTQEMWSSYGQHPIIPTIPALPYQYGSSYQYPYQPSVVPVPVQQSYTSSSNLQDSTKIPNYAPAYDYFPNTSTTVPMKEDFPRKTDKVPAKTTSTSTASKYNRSRNSDYRYDSRNRDRNGDRGHSNNDRNHKDYGRSTNSSRSVRDRDRDRGRDRDREKEKSYSTNTNRHNSKPPDLSRNKNDRPYSKSRRPETERDRLLKNWRKNYCETSADISRKLEELANDEEKEFWTRSSPADLYYKRVKSNVVESSSRLDALCTLFEEELVKRGSKALEKQPPYVPPERKRKIKICKHKSEQCSSDSSDSDPDLEEDRTMEELSRKTQHPYRLHSDLWHNEPGEMNDGLLCRCSVKSRRSGIRHGIYPGEAGFEKCNPNSNNADRLFHYRITISPPTNFLTKTPTIIKHDEHEFLFEGFSLLTHERIEELPTCKVIRFNIEYTILYVEEKIPENFTIKELDLFTHYLFYELLELVDFSLQPSMATGETCPCYHFYPRFVRDLPDNGKEVLAMSEILRYLLDNSGPLVDKKTLSEMADMGQYEWQDYVDEIKGMVVTNPGMKPCSVRVDQLDRNVTDLPECVDENGVVHPVIVHFGIRPPQLSYAGNPEYQKAWRKYVKFRHLIANMSKPSYEDKRKLEAKERRLQEMRTQGRMKRNVTIAISSKNFHRTGIMCDVIQHAMLIPVLTTHLRFHRSLRVLEDTIDYKFKNRYLLQLALTHPSYKENFGTNPDHARNSLTNCGIRQPEYGDRKIHYMNTRKRGINTLINIMSRFGKEYECDSKITHNERLEFLGDAVVEFLTSIHLFYLFPDLEEGGLATYRAAIVQNQHLAVLAKKLHLEDYMLYAHGSDLCHELELRHAMANCFEALMGALLLDGTGVEVPDNVFSYALWLDQPELKTLWENYPPHPLQEQEPEGDRHWINSYDLLKKLINFEEAVGVQFKHIRLLARAFTDRSIGFTNLTLGSNQRLEFLGDTVLQLICSEYLYLHFPEHHEGHLSLLRSSLVNNRTQAVVCDDLGITKFAVYSNPKAELKTKDRADLLEAFLGALYVDKDLEYCEVFCNVCLFPRLQDFIMNQDWNDPKSKLQQCCLTLRTMDGSEPDIPYYKVVESTGPTNTRTYKVAVYFRGKRLASATGHSIQMAEMNAAKEALDNSKDLFPQLDHQKRVIAKSLKRQNVTKSNENLNSNESAENSFEGTKDKKDSNSFLPKQYRSRSVTELSDVSDISSSSLGHLSSNGESKTGDTPKKKRRNRRKKKKKSSETDVKQESEERSSPVEKRPRLEAQENGNEKQKNVKEEFPFSDLSDDEDFDDFDNAESNAGLIQDIQSKVSEQIDVKPDIGDIKLEKFSDDDFDEIFGSKTFENFTPDLKVERNDESDAESGEII